MEPITQVMARNLNIITGENSSLLVELLTKSCSAGLPAVERIEPFLMQHITLPRATKYPDIACEMSLLQYRVDDSL